MLFKNWSKFIILMGRRSSFWNKCIVTARFRFGFLISQTLSLLLEYNFLDDSSRTPYISLLFPGLYYRLLQYQTIRASADGAFIDVDKG